MQAAHNQKAAECYAFYSLSQPVAVAQDFYCKTVLLFISKVDSLKAEGLSSCNSRGYQVAIKGNTFG